MEYTARIHHKDGIYGAEMRERPGDFASGESAEDLPIA